VYCPQWRVFWRGLSVFLRNVNKYFFKKKIRVFWVPPRTRHYQHLTIRIHFISSRTHDGVTWSFSTSAKPEYISTPPTTW
jgi:hypothetical protein